MRSSCDVCLGVVIINVSVSFSHNQREGWRYLQTDSSLPQPALLQLGFINDAVEFGNLILQLLCPLAQSLHLLRQTACLALGCLLCRLHFLLFLTGCNIVLEREDRTEKHNVTYNYSYLESSHSFRQAPKWTPTSGKTDASQHWFPLNYKNNRPILKQMSFVGLFRFWGH